MAQESGFLSVFYDVVIIGAVLLLLAALIVYVVHKPGWRLSVITKRNLIFC